MLLVQFDHSVKFNRGILSQWTLQIDAEKVKSFNRAAQFYDGENRCTILLVDFAGGGGAAVGDGIQIAHIVGTQVLLHRLVDPVQESGNR